MSRSIRWFALILLGFVFSSAAGVAVAVEDPASSGSIERGTSVNP